MNKQEILQKYSIENGKAFSPIPTKSISVLRGLNYGVEIEFPYDKKIETDLLGNFKYYNKQELNGKWKFNLELVKGYPSNVSIGEFTSPILGDDIYSLDQLNLILQLVKAFQHPILKAKERNMHFHFDMNLLGTSLEHLRPLLEIFRAYENIIFRTAASEIGIIRKEGISDRIASSLKEEDISNVLRTYNGGEYSTKNLLTYRMLPINLFNVGAFYEDRDSNALPGVIYKKNCDILRQIESTKFVLDTNLYKASEYDITKKLTPTIEFRLTPSTDNLGYLQQHLLLYSVLIFMARNINKIPRLREKVDARNYLIDTKGPEVFDLQFDEGIDDIVNFLPMDLSQRLLLPYVNSKPISLYKQKDR